MSTYYYYVNHDKKQYFSIGIVGYGNKRSCLGHTAASRALSIMLSEEKFWKNNRICVIGDDSNELEFEKVKQEYENVDIDATLLLFEIDGLEEYEDHLEIDSSFILLCEVALILGDEKVKKYLQKKYGEGWQKKYSRTIKSRPGKSYIDKLKEYQERLGC